MIKKWSSTVLALRPRKVEFIVLVGPSGCGKSTMLRAIAGLEMVDGGSISIAGHNVTDRVPKDRNIAMVFQDYALYPHKTVYENIAFGLRIQKLEEADIHQRVQAAAQKLDLLPLLQRRPRGVIGWAAATGGYWPGDRTQSGGFSL